MSGAVAMVYAPHSGGDDDTLVGAEPLLPASARDRGLARYYGERVERLARSIALGRADDLFQREVGQATSACDSPGRPCGRGCAAPLNRGR